MNHLGSRPTDQKGITLSNDSTKHSSASSYRFSSNLLPAPSFPSPSHVTGKYTDVLSKYDSPLNYSSTTKASIDREARDSISIPSTDPYPSLLLLKDSKTHQFSDVLNQQQILSSLFLPSLSSITSDLASSQSLWSDKYAMKSIPDDVCGEVNKKCAVELLTFINEWRVQRQQIMEARAAKARSRISSFMKGPKRYKDDDSDFMDSEDEEEGLCNVFLLTGSTGCGKTNLVHAAAMSCNCSVLEINTSKERGGQALKRAIEESTQSLSFLGRNNVGESDSSSKKKKDKMSNASITIVLIDEVDVLFENDGDAGFWLGLSNLVKKARSPIILTSTTIPLALRNSISFRFTHSHMKRPTPEECLPYIRNLISAESIQYRSADTEYDQERKLLTVARMYGCDLRKISNEIQLYSNTDSVANTEIRLDERAQHRSNRPVSSLKAITPSITQLNPGNVPSDRHSIIRITGKNFLIDDILSGKENTHRCNKDDNQNVLVTIGDKTCPRAQVIDSSTLLVLCPPCYIPTGIDEYGNRKDTLESSAECRFAPVQIQITSKTGFKFSSDFPLQIGHKPQLIYTFPDYDSDTCNNSNVDDLEESISKFNAEVKNYESHNKRSTSDGSGISVDSNEILSKKQSVDDIDALLMSAELSSDAAFIQDSFGPLASMNLFGAVKGFGFDEVDDIIPSEKTKKPSLEKIYNNNWNGTSFFYGSTDCFMTRPIHKRDRQLLSNHLSSYQYSYSSQSLSNLNSKEPTEEESNSDYFSLLSGPLHLSKSEEGTLMPVQLSESVHSILEVLMEASKFDCVEYSGIRKDAITCQKDYERESNSEVLLELMRKTLGEINVRISDMTKCLCGDIDDRILLDYAPYLRHMAHYECIYDKNYSENMKIMNEDEARLCHQARRSTRRGPKGRENYFDKFVNQNLLYCNGTKGNDLSLMLSQMRLQLEPDVH
jgi:DNA polymerase III delta prime subunit